MVNLNRIYTRTGDQGSTRLSDMSLVAKTDPRVEAYGDVDEANSVLGIVTASGEVTGPLLDALRIIQNSVLNQLKIPEDRVFVNLQKYGNTSTASNDRANEPSFASAVCRRPAGRLRTSESSPLSRSCRTSSSASTSIDASKIKSVKV